MKRNNKKSYVKKSLNVIISELKKEWKIDEVRSLSVNQIVYLI